MMINEKTKVKLHVVMIQLRMATIFCANAENQDLDASLFHMR